MPIALLAVAVGALLVANDQSSQLHENLGEVAADSSVPPGLGTPLVSTRRLTNLLAPSLTEPDFFTALDDMMASAPPSACLSVYLDDRPGPFYQSGANVQVMPSEAMILLTLATAHQRLGPDHTFTTWAQSLVPMENGVVNGDVYLVGGGDPLLQTPAFAGTLEAGQNRLRTPIEDLAQQLVDAGLVLVTGAVVGDATRYDDLLYAPSWPESVVEAQSLGTLLALQFDDGWLQFPVSEPAEDAGEAEPEAGYQAAEDPPFYAAALFDDMLEARDVVIRRSPRSEARAEQAVVHTLASIESAPLSDHYRQILDNRDVETVEMLVKEIGLMSAGVGSTRAGLQAINDTLAGIGIDSERLQFLGFDGSGTDPANTATCPVFTTLLSSGEFAPLFHELLPTAADSAALQRRFAGVRDPGRIRALSARSEDTTAMTGYIDIGLDQELAFAFIANPEDGGGTESARQIETRIVRHLAALEAKPSLDDIRLAPLRLGG